MSYREWWPLFNCPFVLCSFLFFPVVGAHFPSRGWDAARLFSMSNLISGIGTQYMLLILFFIAVVYKLLCLSIKLFKLFSTKTSNGRLFFQITFLMATTLLLPCLRLHWPLDSHSSGLQAWCPHRSEAADKFCIRPVDFSNPCDPVSSITHEPSTNRRRTQNSFRPDHPKPVSKWRLWVKRWLSLLDYRCNRRHQLFMERTLLYV